MTNKYIYFIANWKMFGGINSINSVNKVINFLKSFKKNNITKIIYCPPSTLIHPLAKKLLKSKIDIGAQNCHESKKYGAFTGSINSMMLKNAGANYVIIGHSENRQDGENNKLINSKIKSALEAKLKVIFCVGETLQEKRKKITKKVIANQIKQGLHSIKNKKDIMIAYEPIWSIGSGIIPKPNELFNIINFIKNKFKNFKVLYGGSVSPKNIIQLKSIENIDGFLIGGASQNPKKFIDIIKKTYN